MWPSMQNEAQANRTCVGSQGKFNSNPKSVLGLTNFMLFSVFEYLSLQRFWILINVLLSMLS